MKNRYISDKHHKFPKGESNPRWNGGRCTPASGYVFVKSPQHPNANKQGYVREHVLVMSHYLGRPIAPNEVVHHINGIKDDNRIENLVVITRAEHASHHTKGNVSPESVAALRGKTSEQMRAVWSTTRAHEKRQPFTCPTCGREFASRQQNPKYCSAACYHASRRHTAPP